MYAIRDVSAPPNAWCWHDPIHPMWQITSCSSGTSSAATMKGFSELCTRSVVRAPTSRSCPHVGAALIRITAA